MERKYNEAELSQSPQDLAERDAPLIAALDSTHANVRALIGEMVAARQSEDGISPQLRAKLQEVALNDLNATVRDKCTEALEAQSL